MSTESRLSRISDHAAAAALTTFISSSENSMGEAMKEAIASALPYVQPDRTTLPEDSSSLRTIATLDLGSAEYQLRVVSECGVVKVYSSRDGCLFAMNPFRARLLARELSEALEDAATSVDRATRGEPR